MDSPSLLSYLPAISLVVAAIVSIFTMRLQAKDLKVKIETAQQQIQASKNSIAKDNADTLEKLASITATNADEMEKNLQKSITIRNLVEKVELQNNTIVKLTDDLEIERKERQTAVAEIEHLKSYSDDVIKKLIKRVKRLEAYILDNRLPIPDGETNIEEVDKNV